MGPMAIMSTLLLSAALATGLAGDDDGPPTWRFDDTAKPVKVVVIAGSVGAWQKAPYHERLADVCKNIEVQNLSKTGIGAFAMKQRFRDQVLENPSVKPKAAAPGQEHWVLLAAGVNNLYAPEAANHHLKNIIVLAHMAGMKVVALSPTPWGSAKDKRHAGFEGLQRRDATQLVTDFVMGRLTAEAALGAKASQRPAGAAAPWDPLERPDVGIDMFDSPLRDKAATPRDMDAMRKALLADRRWREAHAKDDEVTRTAALELDAARAAQVPQWFMQPQLRGFDGVHPNVDGHRIMATVACPALPESWGCSCEGLTD